MSTLNYIEIIENIINLNLFEKFLNETINEIINPNQKINLNKYTVEIKQATELNFFKNHLYNIIISATSKKDFNLDEHIQDLPAAAQDTVKLIYEIRKCEISSVIIREKLREIGPIMEDFDWNLKLITGSSSYSSLNEILAQIDFYYSNRNENELFMNDKDRKLISFELNKETLKDLISELEKYVN